MRKNIIQNIKLIFSIAKRFSSQDRSSRSSVTSCLAAAGICFGVMTLIVVMSVMNGFQMSFIKAIQEISSYHIQVEGLKPDSQEEADFESWCQASKNVKLALPFYQAQTLMTSLSTIPLERAGSVICSAMATLYP